MINLVKVVCAQYSRLFYLILIFIDYWSKRKKGGPIGLDPVASLCPNNPLNCVKLPGNLDHEIVVRQRLENLYESLHSAHEQKDKFLNILARLLEKVSRPNVSINEIRKILKLSKLPQKRKKSPKKK